MRTLVAAACIAVLAFVGYYFWGEYEKSVARAEAERRAEAAMCQMMEKDFRKETWDTDWRVLHVTLCVRNKHLSESDFDTPLMKRLYEQARPSIERES